MYPYKMYPYECKLLMWLDKASGSSGRLLYTAARRLLKRRLDKHSGMYDEAEALWFFIWDYFLAKGVFSDEQETALCELIAQYPTYSEEEQEERVARRTL